MNSSTYRPDIDGLRAIAVLWVVLFHAFPQVFPGGFIGVDVFFVISGYLITQIILKDLDTAQFSFKTFYIRRIKRIFPALIVCLVVFLSLGFYLFLADEYQSLGHQVFASAFFMNNFFLIHEAGYFDRVSDLKPLLHLWSLGIEEQFYLLWPLMIWGLWHKKIKIHYGMLVLIGVTFVINLIRAKHHGVDTFYSPQTRLWELGLGGLLAYCPIDKYNFPGKAYLSPGAFILLIFGMFYYHQGLYYPYWYALLPLLAAIILIGLPAYVNEHYLSHAKMVALGRISYPLYLWHWGALSFARVIYGGKITNALALVLVVLSVGLSVLTYQWIEKPIRKLKNQRMEAQLAGLLLGLLVLIGGMGLWIFRHQGLEARSINLAVATKLKDLTHFDDYQKSVKPCDYLSMNDGLNRCYQSDPRTIDTVIWGDSHAEHLFPGMLKASPKSHWLLLSRSSCPPLLGVKAYLQGEEEHCLASNQRVLRLLHIYVEIHTVMLSFLGLYYLSNQDAAAEHSGKVAPIYFHLENPSTVNSSKKQVFTQGLERTVEALLQANKEVILIEDIPLLPFMPSRCIQRPGKYIANDCQLPKEMVLQLQADYHQILLGIQQKYPKIKLLNAMEALCNEQSCPVSKNGHLLYRDSHHLSLYGSEWLAQRIMQRQYS